MRSAVLFLVLSLAALARAQTNVPPVLGGGPSTQPLGQAIDFPPGAFSDGGQYHLADLHGKVIFLVFFNSDSPGAQTYFLDSLRFVSAYKDQPMKCIGVAFGESTTLKGFLQEHHVKAPVFFDRLGAMAAAYEQYTKAQAYVVAPDGTFDEYQRESDMARAMQNAKWKYPGPYDPRLEDLVNRLEWNHYDDATAELRTIHHNAAAALAASADKVYSELRKEGEDWKAQAARLAPDDPVHAYDLYARCAAVFSGDDFAKTVEEPLRHLAAKKAVQDDLAARAMEAKLAAAMLKASAAQKGELEDYCRSIYETYDGTPTASRAKRLREWLQRSHRYDQPPYANH